jgi:hypothetical protein
VGDRRGVRAHLLQHLGQRTRLGCRFDQAQDAVDAQIVALVHVHPYRLTLVAHPSRL